MNTTPCANIRKHAQGTTIPIMTAGYMNPVGDLRPYVTYSTFHTVHSSITTGQVYMLLLSVSHAIMATGNA